jgi:hypothetical protein
MIGVKMGMGVRVRVGRSLHWLIVVSGVCAEVRQGVL